MRVSALLPLACAITGFVLSMLCLFAGSKRGFMEDYHIVTLNTSTLGHDLIPTPTTSTGSTPTATSIGSYFSNLIHNLTSSVEGELANIANEIEGDVADELASKLGIHQWYSWHILDLCEGYYEPNATAKGAHYNVTACTNKTAMYHFTVQNTINSELENGPLHLNVSFINWPSNIQDGLNAISGVLDALFVFYVIGIAAAGLCILTSIVAFFLHGSRLVSFGNWGLAVLSFICLLIASIMITIAQAKISHEVNKYGHDVGIFAYKGLKFLALTWSSVGIMFLATLAWCIEFAVGRRNRGREYTEKPQRRGWGWSRRRSDEAQLRRSGV